MRLLWAGADPNSRDFAEVKRPFWEEVNLLLKRILKSPPASGSLPTSALSLAVQANNTVIATVLLNAGANDVNARIGDRYGNYRTSLVNHSASVGNLDMVKALVAHGADIHKRNKGQISLRDGYSILESALSAHDTPLIPAHRSMDAAAVLERRHREEIFHFLRAQGANYDVHTEEGAALLCAAAEYDWLETARELLVAGAPPNVNPEPHEPGYNSLAFSVANDDITLAKLLLQYGAVGQEEGYEAPILYVHSPEMANLLLAHSANIQATQSSGRSRGDHALDFACMRGDTKIVPFLLAHGLPVNGVHEGITPIEEVAGFGGYETVRLLLQHGAKVGANSPGRDALWWAIEGRHFDSAKLILRYGAALTSATRELPLTAAVEQGSIDLVLDLLQRGANVNAKRGEALRIACQDGNGVLVEMLLKHGANPSLR